MKKIFCILAVALVAGVCIFYACNKDGKEIIPENLTKEAEFIAKNYEETCVQVQVFRDEYNNAQFVIKQVANDPDETMSFRISEDLKVAHQLSKSDDVLRIEIPNDAIYWLVSFDGSEPEKFAPNSNAKAASTTFIECRCSCPVGIGGYPSDSDCKLVQKNINVYVCEKKDKMNNFCKECLLREYVRSTSGGSSTAASAGSSYLIKSNTLTINGILYQ